MIIVNKGLIGAVKVTLISLVLLILLFFIFNFIPVTAETIDAKIHFSQCADDSNNDNIKDDCEWIEGAINQNNAIYSEGDVVPHRLFHTISSAGTHTMRFRYEFSKGDVYAYDFISIPNITQSGSLFNPCANLPSFVSSTDCNSLFSNALQVSIPSDTFDTVSSRENPASRKIFIGGVSSPSVTIVGHDPSTSCFQNCGDSDAFIDVTFTTPSDDTIVAVWFGGHLAQAADPDGAGSLLGWGTGYGAASISGAPFHVSYKSLDGDSVGKRDNQIQPGTVVAPCDSYTSNNSCELNTNCDWCPLCQYSITPTKVNQWLQGRCVNAGTDCGYHCETGWCGATCDEDSDCTCPTDGCVGPDYYDYPVYGSCVDCPTSCYCQDGTGSSQPCAPTITYNDPRCGECQDDDDCNSLDRNYCVDTVIKHDEGKCVNYFCEVETAPVEDCNDGLYCNGQETCLNAACVPGTSIDCSSLNGECQEGKCDESLDDCVPDYTDFPLSTPCSSGDSCKINHCDGLGECVLNYNIDCNDNDACTNDFCESLFGCKHTTVNCDDGNECTEDSCDSVKGCIHTPIPNCCKTNDDCNDSDACTNDVCIDSQCYNNVITCNDGVSCTDDTCDPSKGCVYTPDDRNCPADTTCADNYCDALLGCQANYADYSTPCEADELFCRVDHCDGVGSCVYWKDYECSGLDLEEIATCDWIPDDYLATFDYAQPFTSICDEVNDECTDGSQTITHTCADADSLDGGPIIPEGDGIRTCDAECDGFGTECESKCIGDTRYFNGNCDTNPASCKCSYDSEDCDKDGCYVYETGCEDRDYYCAIDGCKYNAYNQNIDGSDSVEKYCLDDQIREHRKFHDFYCNDVCDDHTSWIDDNLVEDCSLRNGWYNSTTQWVDDGQCKEKEQVYQQYFDYTCSNEECVYDITDSRWVDTGNTRNKEDGTTCDDGLYCTVPDTCTAGICGGPARDCSSLDDKCQEGVCNEDLNSCVPDYTDFPLSTPCEADDNKCTIDHCDGFGECIKWKDIPTPSVPNKIVGDPKTKCLETDWCEWKITTLTPIIVSCGDGFNLTWRYALDGDWKEWHTDDSNATIYFPEESNHTLEVYCSNECGESEHDIEKFKVEGRPFEIPLYKKWNLISVPFVLTNGSVSEVFKNISDDIASVWTYDNGVWYTWTPELGGTLEHVKPGWGYWVLAKEDTKLLISGSLLSPVTTPPSKALQEGWNLIGYYGTEWQSYELETDGECGYVNYNYGNYVYCSLNSLIDTEIGFPRWSSLWGYDNCEGDVAYWHALESCFEGFWKNIKMYASKGYWIEMDVEDGYAPATNCIWNEDLHCSPPAI